MEEFKINDQYKYVSDENGNYRIVYLDGSEIPKKPKKLFKFYDTNLHSVAALHEAYFWLSKPKEFNDPFDCNLNLVQHENEDELFADNCVPNNILDLGITCFTQEVDELLFWAHYANNYRGFAIEFNPETLRVQMDENVMYSLDPVLYVDEFLKVKNTDGFAMSYCFTAKSSRWKYENEWRFLCTIDEKKPFDRIKFYFPIAVKALYIGHKLFDENESIFHFIESIFKTKYPDKPVYVVYPNPRKLELIFEERP